MVGKLWLGKDVEVVMVYSKVLSQHLYGGTEENHKKALDQVFGLRIRFGTYGPWKVLTSNKKYSVIQNNKVVLVDVSCVVALIVFLKTW